MEDELNQPASPVDVQICVIAPDDTAETTRRLSRDVEEELAKAAASMLKLSSKKRQQRRTRSSSSGQYCDRCSQKLSDLEFPYHASRCTSSSFGAI